LESKYIKLGCYKFDDIKSMKSISDIMSTKVEIIQTSDSAKDAAKKMLDKNVSSLVVVDESGQSIGIITERDITRGVCIHDILSKEFMIHHLMTSPLTTIDSNSPVEMAANLMLQKKVRHLIVREENKTIGIVTATNFIDYLNEKLDPVDPNAKLLRSLKDEI
jgi:signal-transduction protein with cAMP-binding, CBS, and nucleotidyltransferase domain